MSGGVDSAVAALLVARAGREAVAVTLELWRDPANDAEASCCSAHAVRLARSVAHRMGLPHLTLDLRAEFAAGVVEPFLADYAAGLTPNPCVRCNGHVRLDAMLAVRRPPRRRRPRHRPLRAASRADGLLRARRRPGQGPGLHARRARAGVGRADALPARRADQARGARARPRGRAARSPIKRESQDLCFLAGTGKRAFLARHGGAARAPGRDRRPRRAHARPPPRPAPVHGRPAQGARRRRRGAALRARQGRGATRVVVGHARRAGARRRSRSATPSCTGRPARSTRSGCATARGRWPARADGREDGALRLALEEPVDGAAPGQVACLLRGDVVVGYGDHRRLTRCQAATLAASASSPRAIIASSSATREAGAAQVHLGRVRRRRPGFESRGEPDVEVLVEDPVGEEERPEPLHRRRAQAGLLGELAARRAPPRARPARPPRRPAGTPRRAAGPGGGTARRARRRRPSSGTITAPGDFSTQA